MGTNGEENVGSLSTGDGQVTLLDPRFLAILANPIEPDRPPLKQIGNFLVCSKTGVGFRIVNGIPHLLPEQAIPAHELAELIHER